MRGARIKAKLRAGEPVFTTALRFHAPRLVEMLARSGVDQVFLARSPRWSGGSRRPGKPWRS